MKTLYLLIATLIASATANLQSASILYIGNDENASYKAFVENLGYSWTFKANGSGAEQIGGTLSSSRVLNGVSQSQSSFLNSFDLVISGIGITSSNWTDATGWAAITAPMIVHHGNVARTGNMSLFNTNPNFVFTAGNQTNKLGSDASSNAIFNGIAVNPSNLFGDGLENATFAAGSGMGGGIRVSENTGNNGTNIAYWSAGSTTGGGATLGGDRIYFALAAQPFSNLTADGLLALENSINLIAIPELNSLALLAASSLLLTTARRRRQRA